MTDIFNADTDLAVFVFMVLAWTSFVFLKVLFESSATITSFWKNILLGYVRTSYIFIIVWLSYAAFIAEFDHEPWPLNLILDRI